MGRDVKFGDFYRSLAGDINFIRDRARCHWKRSKDTAAAVSFLIAEEADVWTILPCFMGTVSSG